MNCRDAKREIALHVGHDEVEATRWEAVRRHVSDCPECRSHYRQIKQTLKTLEHADAPSTYETRDSLWPELASRLDAAPRRPDRHGHRRWLPYSSFVVACLLFVMVWAYSPPPPAQPLGPPVHRGISPLSDWSSLPRHESPRIAPPAVPEEAPERETGR